MEVKNFKTVSQTFMTEDSPFSEVVISEDALSAANTMQSCTFIATQTVMLRSCDYTY